ncbi:MAG: GNAT family N-acetyltransferase [Rhizobiaceae bacterium]|nr:GNAT family N-acetyltransferase [Rhizobiaceae bacterium]MCV0408062.1 GNAT family N-acetyltransferase [Rhizobiaceae bacterium]
MPAVIRPARTADLDALVAIETAAFSGDRLTRRSLARLISVPSACVLVADCEGEVLGYCVVLFRASTTLARLYSIAVAKGGHGIGRALLEAAEVEAVRRGRGGMTLEVREDNGRAVSLYRRAGYAPKDRVAGYYADGADALRFRRTLGAAEASSADEMAGSRR